MKAKKKLVRRLISVIMVVCILVSTFVNFEVSNTYGYTRLKTITLESAKALALKNSSDYKTVKSDITLLNTKYIGAIKAIEQKKRDLSTFRWSPLLSFKFPESPDMVTEYEFTYKPLKIQSDIKSKKHELDTIVYKIYEEIQLKYVEAYVAQEKIAFYTNRKEKLEENIERNKARLLVGEANQSDIDKMESSLKNIDTNLSNISRSFESTKKDIKGIIKLDITSGYKFENPLVTAELSRNDLDSMIKRTLDKDQEYYDALLEESLAYTSIATYEKLMRNQYGGKMNVIQTFINQAKSKQEIDYDAFKAAYDKLQKNVDKPWAGSFRILFFRFSMEFFKGKISGVRYIQDEPYALITAAKEYASASKNAESVKENKTKEIETSFNTIVSLKNSYLEIEERIKKNEKDYEQKLIKNKAGLLTYEEVSEAKEELDELKIEYIDMLASYTNQVYTFDRQTLGAVTELLGKKGMDNTDSGDGISVVEGAGGATYNISSKIENNLFEFKVSIPEEFEPEITHYELWVNGVQIGNRTEKDKSITHLMLDLEEVEISKVRFYNEDEFVDDVEFDSSTYSGILNIKNGYIATSDKQETLANYMINAGTIENMVELKITPLKDEISFFQIKNSEGKAMLGDDLINISDSFNYLSILRDSLKDLKVEFYDKDETKIYVGTFDEETMQIVGTPQ